MKFAVFLGWAIAATRHERGLKRRQLVEKAGLRINSASVKGRFGERFIRMVR